MVLGDSSEHIDLITDHMFTTFHQLFVDDFHRIVLASFNLDTIRDELVGESRSAGTNVLAEGGNLHAWPLQLHAKLPRHSTCECLTLVQTRQRGR